MTDPQKTPLLSVQGLEVTYSSPRGPVVAVDGVSFDVAAGETLGLVGESGCGKSTAALALLGLVPPPGQISAGRIVFQGRDLTQLAEEELREVRGREIAFIFQEPAAALNPVMRIGGQLSEGLEVHLRLPRKEAWRRGAELLAEAGIAAPEECMRAYPFQLSGGMRQRALIAMALACEPLLLIGDEPTTALDVSIQAQILELLKALQRKRGLSLLVISHDWGVIAELADRVAVMYAGQIVEAGRAQDVFERPSHPYTQLLLQSVPRLDQDLEKMAARFIPGAVPDLTQLPAGCRFHPRCPEADRACRQEPPALIQTDPRRLTRCLKRGPQK